MIGSLIGARAVIALLCAVAAVAPAALRAQTVRPLGIELLPELPRDTLGARVGSVASGSLAQRLGLRTGDRIIRLGQVDFIRHRTDPRNAANGVGRLRVALSDTADLVPVLVMRDGRLMTGIGSWSGEFVPVPLHDAEALIGALNTLATQGTVPVESFGGVEVPQTGGSVAVPQTGGSVAVPQATVPQATVPQATVPKTGDGALGSRAWRAACAGLQGTRLTGKYFWLSSSGSSSEQLWLNADGSYSTHRASAYSSYAEDGCYAIAGNRITFYKALSSAMASAPGSTSQNRVSLGSASESTFEPRTVSFAMEGGARGVLVINGDRYTVTTDR